MINPEIQISTGSKFLTFKRLKIRGKSETAEGTNNPIDYFNHPFEIDNGIRLQTDVDKEKTVSLISLATDLESIEDREMEFKETPKKRPTIEDVKRQSSGRVLNSLGVHLTDGLSNNIVV